MLHASPVFSSFSTDSASAAAQFYGEVLGLDVAAMEDATATARWLTHQGVILERLEWCDDDGVARDPNGVTPTTAWLKYPAGNWLSILESDDDA